MPLYPALPGLRMPYDDDGTLGFQIDQDDNAITQLTQSELQILNNEGMDSISARSHAAHGSYTGLIFPQLRDVTAYFLANNGGQPAYQLQTSTDTTNGLDGTWTTQISGTVTASTVVSPDYRSSIQTVTWTGIKALRFSAGSFFNNDDIYAFHLYGNIHTGATPDRLRLWHPTLNQEVSGDYFNWNDINRGSTDTKQFRVKNNSSLTAYNISVAIEALTDTTPSFASAHSLNTTTIGSLGPGLISPVITLTRNTPLTATLGLWAARIVATATAFI